MNNPHQIGLVVPRWDEDAIPWHEGATSLLGEKRTFLRPSANQLEAVQKSADRITMAARARRLLNALIAIIATGDPRYFLAAEYGHHAPILSHKEIAFHAGEMATGTAVLAMQELRYMGLIRLGFINPNTRKTILILLVDNIIAKGKSEVAA